MEATGMVRGKKRAPQGFETRLQGIRVLSKPAQPMLIAISEWKLNTSLETKPVLRPISLRSIRERVKFKAQERIVKGFRDYLFGQGLTEIRTSKTVARGAEGGSNVFHLGYLNKKAELDQSPQFYKQTVVGVHDEVFEVAPVFRVEKHNTIRHLNEYVSLDFEMGYIDGLEDMTEVETGMLQYVVALLEQDYKKELDLLKVTLPDVNHIPAVCFDEAKWLVSETYSRKIHNPYDPGPEEELLIGHYFEEKPGSDFVFVTHYPSKKRPFYAMDGPQDPKFTLSLDLLLRGSEVTTGGQRVHDYDRIIEKMTRRDMDLQDIQSYLMVPRHGMPSHGGLGIGLERLTTRLLDKQNVGETCIFPRDMTRLGPQDAGEACLEKDMIGIRERHYHGKYYKQ